MIKEEDLTKLYYSIGEVAKMFEVNTSLIRFWEKEFKSIKPKKNKKGNRLFSPQNILEIQKIYGLVKEEGHTLEGSKKALQAGDVHSTENPIDRKAIIEHLETIKTQLLLLKRWKNNCSLFCFCLNGKYCMSGKITLSKVEKLIDCQLELTKYEFALILHVAGFVF